MKQTESAQVKRQTLPAAIALPGRAALQTRQAAAYVSVSVRTLFRLRKRGFFEPNNLTGRTLWPVCQLDEFLHNSNKRVL
jgi:hypothetical protein